MQPNDGVNVGRRTSWFGLAAFVALLSAAILVPFVLWDDTLEPLALTALDQQANEVLRSLVVVGLLTADVLLPIPSSLVMVGAAVALPVVSAFLSCFVGLMLGCLLGYTMGRLIGEPLLARLSGPASRAMLIGWFARRGVSVVAVCRPIPMLAELSVVMAGSARLPVLPFLFSCTAANAGVAGVYVALGAQVSDLWTFVAAFAASCVVPATGWLVVWWFGKFGGHAE